MTQPHAAAFATVLALAALSPAIAFAQPAPATDAVPVTPAAPTPSTPRPPAAEPASDATTVRGVVGGALTFGGEKVVSVPLSDGTTRSVSTGGLLDGWLGVQVRPAGGPVSILATIGYHVDCVCASNGDIYFSRVPFELIGMYDVAPRWRIGAGYRHTADVRLRSSGSAPGYAQDFDDGNGAILQGEWMATRRLGVVLRVVSEKYGYTQTYVNANDQIVTEHVKKDGTHGGIGLNWYFF